MAIRGVLTVVGVVLVALGAVALLGWIQEGDPDCILETGVFLQLRMCAPEIAGEPASRSFVRLAVILAMFVAGGACLWFARRKKY
jgi:hypothetical protein